MLSVSANVARTHFTCVEKGRPMGPRTPTIISSLLILEKEKRAVPKLGKRGTFPRRMALAHKPSDVFRFVRHRLFASVRFLEGFAMDVDGLTYCGLDDAIRCWYDVAGVVDIMMTYVMGVRDEPTRLLRDSPDVFSVCQGRRDGQGDSSGHRAGCSEPGAGTWDDRATIEPDLAAEIPVDAYSVRDHKKAFFRSIAHRATSFGPSGG